MQIVYTYYLQKQFDRETLDFVQGKLDIDFYLKLKYVHFLGELGFFRRIEIDAVQEYL